MSGFQSWLADLWQAQLERVCWFIGHSWKVGEWRRSPYTVHTHSRDHRCKRCGHNWSESGYFNALNPEHRGMFQ